MQNRTDGRTAGAVRTTESIPGQAVAVEGCTTEVASRSCSDSSEARMPVVGSARRSTLLAGSSQLVAGTQRSRHVADPLQLPVSGTAATLQLPVLTEKPALVQSNPKLKSLVVAAVADSA